LNKFENLNVVPIYNLLIYNLLTAVFNLLQRYFSISISNVPVRISFYFPHKSILKLIIFLLS